MSSGISSIRPLQASQIQPIDFSALNGLGAGAKHSQNDAASNSSIDPGAFLLAGQNSSQVNFEPPNSTESSTRQASKGVDGSATDIVQQLMSLLMGLMKMFTQSKDQSNGTSNDVAAGSSTNAAGVNPGDTSGGITGGGADNVASTSVDSPADSAAQDTSLSGGGALHLPQQLEQYRADIMGAAKATGMPASVIAGQIWAESRGQLDAASTNVNGKADAGLMQVNADTFKSLQQQNPGLLGSDVTDPKTNIMAGALYLRDQNQAFGNIGAALRAYNSGPDKVNLANLADSGGVGGSSYPADVLKFSKIIESGEGHLPA